MTDQDYFDALGLEGDFYAFSERVSLMLEHIDDPTDKQIDDAREEALLCS